MTARKKPAEPEPKPEVEPNPEPEAVSVVMTVNSADCKAGDTVEVSAETAERLVSNGLARLA